MSTTTWWEEPSVTDSNKQYLDSLYQKAEDRAEEKRARKNLKSAVLDPESNIMYMEGGVGKDKVRIPIINRNTYIKTLSAGQINSDKGAYVFIYPEFHEEAKEFYKSQAQTVNEHGLPALAMSAGVVTSNAFPNLSTALILTSFTNLEEAKAQKYNLVQAVSTRQMNNLYIRNLKFDGIPKPMIRQISEMEEIETADFGSFTEERFTLEKWGGGYDFSEEWYMREAELDQPIRQMHLDRLSDDFIREKNDQIAVALPDLTDIVGASLVAIGAGEYHHTNDPVISVVNPVIVALAANDFVANRVISNNAVLSNYLNNTHIAGFMENRGAIVDAGQRVVTNVPKWPGVSWYINDTMPNSKLFAFNDQALAILQGPKKAVQIEKQDPEIKGTRLKEWFKFRILDPNGGREVTTLG
jgi:hypothetical protein